MKIIPNCIKTEFSFDPKSFRGVNEQSSECVQPLSLLMSKSTFHISQSLDFAATLLTCATLWRSPAATQKHKHTFIFSKHVRHFILSVETTVLDVKICHLFAYCFYTSYSPVGIRAAVNVLHVHLNTDDTWKPTFSTWENKNFTDANAWHPLQNEFTQALWPWNLISTQIAV